MSFLFVSSYHGCAPVADTISGFLSISCSSRIVTPFVLVTVIVPVVPYSQVSRLATSLIVKYQPPFWELRPRFRCQERPGREVVAGFLSNFSTQTAKLPNIPAFRVGRWQMQMFLPTHSLTVRYEHYRPLHCWTLELQRELLI